MFELLLFAQWTYKYLVSVLFTCGVWKVNYFVKVSSVILISDCCPPHPWLRSLALPWLIKPWIPAVLPLLHFLFPCAFCCSTVTLQTFLYSPCNVVPGRRAYKCLLCQGPFGWSRTRHVTSLGFKFSIYKMKGSSGTWFKLAVPLLCTSEYLFH